MEKFLNKITYLVIGFVTGMIVILITHHYIYRSSNSYAVKETAKYLKVDELRKSVRQGNARDYECLKRYFQQEGRSEDILFYAMIMADRYHDYTTCDDVCNSLKEVFKKYDLGEFDNDTRKLFLYYKRKSKDILLKDQVLYCGDVSE